MTQEEKQLLLIDLSARLPYGVKVRISNESDGCSHVNTTILDTDNLHKYILNGGYYKRGLFYKTPNFQLLPYLRPMSSMTEEEKKEFQACHCVYELHPDFQPMMCNLANELNMFNWLNSNHFDYRGLIPMDLALEAPEGMYKNE